MADSDRATIRFPKDRAASYRAALYYLVAARDLLEEDGIIEFPAFGEALAFPDPGPLDTELEAFVAAAWEQTEQLLINTEPGATTPQDIANGIAAGWRLVRQNPQLPFSSPEYEKWRHIVTTRFVVPTIDSRPHWPPPLQTQLNHSGPSWDDVKTAAGWVLPPVAPRSADLPPTDEKEREEMLQALRLFIAHCEDAGVRTAQARYRGWVGMESEEGRYRPAPAHIREAFGTWLAALDAARDS